MSVRKVYELNKKISYFVQVNIGDENQKSDSKKDIKVSLNIVVKKS